MKTTRKENEFVLRKEDIVYEFVPWAIAGMIAILMVVFLDNYLVASILVFEWMKYFGSEKIHFYKNKPIKFILKRYPYSTKMLLTVLVIVSVFISFFSIIGFILTIVTSICWSEYMKLMKTYVKRKSLI